MELDLHRHFAAPREIVYKAFIDEGQIPAWYGPSDFWVLPETVSVDAQVGGHRRLTMVTYDGQVSSLVNSTFTQVIENQRLVGYEVVTGLPHFAGVERFTFSFEFLDEGGGTRLELRQGPFSAEMEAVAREAWLQSFTKLDALFAA